MCLYYKRKCQNTDYVTSRETTPLNKTDKLACHVMYIHIILKITEGQTFLLLQISTVSTAPDYFLTRRQKR